MGAPGLLRSSALARCLTLFSCSLPHFEEHDFHGGTRPRRCSYCKYSFMQTWGAARPSLTRTCQISGCDLVLSHQLLRSPDLPPCGCSTGAPPGEEAPPSWADRGHPETRLPRERRKLAPRLLNSPLLERPGNERCTQGGGEGEREEEGEEEESGWRSASRAA